MALFSEAGNVPHSNDKFVTQQKTIVISGNMSFTNQVGDGSRAQEVFFIERIAATASITSTSEKNDKQLPLEKSSLSRLVYEGKNGRDFGFKKISKSRRTVTIRIKIGVCAFRTFSSTLWGSEDFPQWSRIRGMIGNKAFIGITFRLTDDTLNKQCYTELQSVVGRPHYENVSRYVQVSSFYESPEKYDSWTKEHKGDDKKSC